MYFFEVFIHIIFPIFLQIGTGYLLKKMLDFALKPLAVIQLYIIIPALMFVKIYAAEAESNIFLNIVLHTTLLFALLYGVSMGVARLMRLSKSHRTAFTNSVSFYNAGNYSIPLAELLYGGGIGVMTQVIVMTIQNVLLNIFGVFTSCRGSVGMKKSLLEIIKIPMLYSALIAFFLKFFSVGIPQPVWNALDSLGSAMVPVALIALGAQLADTKLRLVDIKIFLSAFLRLMISPVIAFLLVWLLRVEGVVAQVLVISSAVPTAANTALIAIQYDNESDFAAQTVFVSTLLSAVTVTLVIMITQMIVK